MKAMLFAAGLGTRLKPYTDTLPKALVEVNNKTLLEHNIRYLQQFGIFDVVVNVHHFAGQVEHAIEANGGFGSNITVSDERELLLETGGGLKKVAQYFMHEEAFVVMNVDILTNLQLDKMILVHKGQGRVATLAVMKRNSSRKLLFNGQMQLCGWRNEVSGAERIARPDVEVQPFAFSGIQVLSSQIFEDSPFEGKFSLVDLYLHQAKSMSIYGYDHTGDLLIDVGKPDSIEQAAEMFK